MRIVVIRLDTTLVQSVYYWGAYVFPWLIFIKSSCVKNVGYVILDPLHQLRRRQRQPHFKAQAVGLHGLEVAQVAP